MARYVSPELDLALRSDLSDDEDDDPRWRYWEKPERDSARARRNLPRQLDLWKVELVIENVLDDLLVSLEAALRSPERPDSGLGKRMAERAVADLDVIDVLVMLKARHWDDFSLPQGCKVRNLIKHLRPALIERLGEELRTMLDRWYVDGCFELKSRHRREVYVDLRKGAGRTARTRPTGKEREVRLTPLYEPKGRA